MKILPLAGCVSFLLTAQAALALPPVVHTQACSVSVDGNRLDTVLTPGGADQRNTFAYEPLTHRWHFWGFLADDANFPSAASSLRAVVHATSSDGVHFTSDGNLSYAFGSAYYGNYAASIDPPLDFFRAVYDTQTGTWKLFNWTENDQPPNSRFGQYNYNTSVNDLGTVAGTTNVVHQGPLKTPVAGNHVGTFGLVDGMLYLRADTDGGADQFAYTDGAYPWTGANQPSTGSELTSANLFNGTPYCWFLTPGCGTSDPRIPAYVHNVGRTLRQDDGVTIGTYYAFRDANTYARLDQQIWYVESTDNGTTWSTPVGVFPDPSSVTIDGQPLDAAPGGKLSDVEMVLKGSRYQAYFSTQDADGNYVMVTAQGRPSDAIFWNGFDACD
ncbi:MAG: hypothetical protein JSR27_12285 [Proteobacteria bacterium]|nr:hypothetical protein [Pseudomonadota bacterium]